MSHIFYFTTSIQDEKSGEGNGKRPREKGQGLKSQVHQKNSGRLGVKEKNITKKIIIFTCDFC